jgi:hypothetical protein
VCILCIKLSPLRQDYPSYSSIPIVFFVFISELSIMSDWDSVTILRKRQDTTRTAKNQAALNAAFRSGAVVGTEKKCRFLSSVNILLSLTHYTSV